jgi:hypothetical protein
VNWWCLPRKQQPHPAGQQHRAGRDHHAFPAGGNFGGTSASVVNEGFETGNFVAYVSGTAKSEIHMKSREVFVDVTGTGTLNLFGSADKLKANVEGVSGLYALYFPVQDVTLDVAGTGTARVNAERTIRAKASGASTIRYKGNARIESQEIARLSSLKKM